MDLNEIQQSQPTLNIGIFGPVFAGKSSVTKCLTHVKTQKHSEELKRNITMKLGYANGKIFKCTECPSPEAYQPFNSDATTANCNLCGREMILKKHFSIVDCPGHTMLMATMLNGTCVMDTSIVVESVGNEKLPSSQTIEHLLVAKIADLHCSFVCLNKLDLVDKDTAIEKVDELQESLKGTVAEFKDIVPISANFKANIDIVCQKIAEHPDRIRNLEEEFKMIIVRSFNINYPDCQIKDLVGGVVGGTVLKGIIKKGDQIKILPGFVKKNKNNNNIETGRLTYKPITSTVTSINSENNILDFAIPGGLIGLGLTIDPGLTVKDSLIGKVVIPINCTVDYKIYETVKTSLNLLHDRCKNLNVNDKIIVNCHAANIYAQIVKINLRKKKAIIKLEDLICVQNGEYITLCTNNKSFVVIGQAKIISGVEAVMS